MPILPLDWSQQTRASRVIFAVLAGAASGASIEAALVFNQLRTEVGVLHTTQYLVDRSREIFTYAFIIFLIGIVVFGLPVWRVLHTSGRRAWFHAVIAGATVPFMVYSAFATGFFTGRANGNWSYYGNGSQHWVDGVITMFGLRMALLNAAQLGVMGALVGLVIWRVAYRREG